MDRSTMYSWNKKVNFLSQNIFVETSLLWRLILEFVLVLFFKDATG